MTAATASYDVIVLGAGPAGENVADRAVRGGLTVAIVEDELVGGECSYWACMPTKALLRSGAALESARRVPGAREAITGRLDVTAILERRDSFASSWKDDGQVSWLQAAGIDLHRGWGRLAGDRQVEVTDVNGQTTHLAAKHAVVIATGSSAIRPPIRGLADVPVWTNREAVAVTDLPGRIAIVGAGAVGSEMATAFARLGSQVTVLARDGVLPSSEPFAGELVIEALKEMGVTVDLGNGVVGVRREHDDSAVLTLENGSQVPTDQVFLAVGRAPNTDDVGLAHVGLRPGSWLPVDETLQVVGSDGTPLKGGWLYAVGDVNRRALLTHQGKYQARIAGDAIVARAAGRPVDEEPWGWHAATADLSSVPHVVFTDPEVAAVGLTAARAANEGYRVRVIDYDLGSVAGAALHTDGYHGQARMVVDEDRQVIIGMTFVGPDVAELLHAATIAIVGEIPLKRLWHAVPAYPTLSEVWLRLLEAYGRPVSRRPDRRTASSGGSTPEMTDRSFF